MSKKKKLEKESYEQELYLEELSNEKLKLALSLKNIESANKLG